jgi:dTDP-4-dehydrorhamnose reductase
MSRKIAILGSRGMLGQAVEKYFASNNDILKFDEHYTIYNRSDFMSNLKSFRPDVVINCIGKIKQKSSQIEDLLTSNTLLPLDLNASLSDPIIIHPSTDCVFSGDHNDSYDVFDVPNASDDYGLSKLYGEFSGQMRKHTFVLRTSIIGTTKNYESEGLLDWFMRQSDGSSIAGYTNHLWNGITTLEWCKLAEKIISGIPLRKRNRIIQVGASNTLSKYELLVCANDIFDRNIFIEPKKSPDCIARVLNPDIKLPSVQQQLSEYWCWMNHK